VIEFTSSTSSDPPGYHVGEAVPVLYLDTDRTTRNWTLFSLWGGAVILGGIGAVFLLIGGGMILYRCGASAWMTIWRTKACDRGGHSGVGINTDVSINGRNPFRIVAQWQDPATAKGMYSRATTSGSTRPAISSKKAIRVFVDPANPKKILRRRVLPAAACQLKLPSPKGSLSREAYERVVAKLKR